MLLVSFGGQSAHFRGYFETDNEMEDITIYEFQVKSPNYMWSISCEIRYPENTPKIFEFKKYVIFVNHERPSKIPQSNIEKHPTLN